MGRESGKKPAFADGRRWKLAILALGLVFLGWLALGLFRPVPMGWPWYYTYFAMPLVGVIVVILLGVWVYELFAIDLAFLVDTLRFLARKLLPRRWRGPVSASITRWWMRGPAWMHTSLWMPDDKQPHGPSVQAPRSNETGHK